MFTRSVLRPIAGLRSVFKLQRRWFVNDQNSQKFAESTCQLEKLRDYFQDHHTCGKDYNILMSATDTSQRLVCLENMVKHEPEHGELLMHYLHYTDWLHDVYGVMEACDKLDVLANRDNRPEILDFTNKKREKYQTFADLEAQEYEQLLATRPIEHTWKPFSPINEYKLLPKTKYNDKLKQLKHRWKELKLQNEAALMGLFCKEWSIHTGMIENAYKLPPKVTFNLILRNLNLQEILSESDGDYETLKLGDHTDPSHINAIIRDQTNVIHMAYRQITEQKLRINEEYLLLSHKALLANARIIVYDKIRMAIPLGKYKIFRNNASGFTDGNLHEYCPPEDVQSEMNRFFSCFEEYTQNSDIDELQLACWAHHIITYIHPFMDGNGRMARLISSLILLKHGLPGFIVPATPDGDIKNIYFLNCLDADGLDLSHLMNFKLDMIENTIDEIEIKLGLYRSRSGAWEEYKNKKNGWKTLK